jgi:hypothetical protein
MRLVEQGLRCEPHPHQAVDRRVEGCRQAEPVAAGLDLADQRLILGHRRQGARDGGRKGQSAERDVARLTRDPHAVGQHRRHWQHRVDARLAPDLLALAAHGDARQHRHLNERKYLTRGVWWS